MKRFIVILFTLASILFLPPNVYSNQLESALFKYQNIADTGGWNSVPYGKKLQIGTCGERVVLLRSRLFVSGDVSEATGDCFDAHLENGVKLFQNRHGLEPDGIVGKATLKELNISVKDRIEQIIINIERQCNFLQDQYLLINIPAFELYVVEYGQVINSIKVIVGKKKNQTPLLAHKIKYIEINPYWNIPHKIAVKEFLPIFKNNFEYISKENIKVFENWSKGAQEIDPESINWSVLTKENFHYKLRQEPGGMNALGYIKFVFPNQFSVYLHGTNDYSLFNRVERAFSHGCIRIEKPIDLALYLLKDDSGWTSEKIKELIEQKESKIIKLLAPTDIYTVYWTAWVDQEGVVNFRDDVYGWDR